MHTYMHTLIDALLQPLANCSLLYRRLPSNAILFRPVQVHAVPTDRDSMPPCSCLVLSCQHFWHSHTPLHITTKMASARTAMFRDSVNETTDHTISVNVNCQAMLCQALSEHLSAPASRPVIRTFSESRRPPRSQRVSQFAGSHALFVPRQATLRTCGTVMKERAAPWAGLPLPTQGPLHRYRPK